jgi:hypothetical protein
MDPRYFQEWALDRAMECTQAPHQIPPWIPPSGIAQDLFLNGHGTAPDIIYTRRVSEIPPRDFNTLDRNPCAIILIEISFC